MNDKNIDTHPLPPEAVTRIVADLLLGNGVHDIAAATPEQRAVIAQGFGLIDPRGETHVEPRSFVGISRALAVETGYPTHVTKPPTETPAS